MKRRILNILFIGIIVINFNGCYFDEITCDDETAQELVEEIIMEDVLKAIYTSEMTGNLMNKFKNRVVSPSYAQFKNNAHVDKFVLSSFITTNKYKDLRKVECKAISNMSISGETYNFDVKYNAQLTDDGKEVFVEVSSFYHKVN